MFDTTGGTDAVITRDMVGRNEEYIIPITRNDNTGKKYVILYDPALRADNSFILIGEIYKDPTDNELKGRIINGYNLITQLPNGDKKILTSVEQLTFLRKVIVDYNGNAPDYENIILFVDPGAGGGGNIYADFLMQDFVDEYGIKHSGLIDMDDEKSALEAHKFPGAVKGVLHLYAPSKYKPEFFAAMGDLVSQDLIKFPITSFSSSGRLQDNKGKEYELTKEELRGLLEIDLMKEETFQMRKIKTDAGNIKYDLPPDKKRRMNDDRAYCFGAFCYILSQVRRKEKFDIEAPKNDLSSLYKGNKRAGHGYVKKQSNNPFGNRNNPFIRR